MNSFKGWEWLVLNRAKLADAVNGTNFMLENFHLASPMLKEKAGPANLGEITHVRGSALNWLGKLDDLVSESKVIESLVGREEDVLGA